MVGRDLSRYRIMASYVLRYNKMLTPVDVDELRCISHKIDRGTFLLSNVRHVKITLPFIEMDFMRNTSCTSY